MSAPITDESSAPLNELFEMLSHEHRRRILMAVARDRPQYVDEIASKSVATEHEKDDNAIKRLDLQLYHVHVPKLDDAGFVDWDRDTGLITRGRRFEEINPLLTLMHDHQDEYRGEWL